MTLWVFGDSYANGHESKHWFWSESLATKLSTDIQNLGKAGTGLEFTYAEVQNNYNRFKEHDVVVICLTQFHRQYFIPGRPQISILTSLDNDFITPKEIRREYKSAIELFYKKLYREENSKVNFTNFLFFLEYLANRLNLQIIGIPCFSDVDEFLSYNKDTFPSVHFASGNLFSVSENECNNEEVVQVFYDYEARANHICRRNHEVLVTKLSNYLINNVYIDLSTDFHKGFMTKEICIDKNFADHEYLYPDKMLEVTKYNLFRHIIKRPTFP